MKKIIFGIGCMISGMILLHVSIAVNCDASLDAGSTLPFLIAGILLPVFGFILGIMGLCEKKSK